MKASSIWQRMSENGRLEAIDAMQGRGYSYADMARLLETTRNAIIGFHNRRKRSLIEQLDIEVMTRIAPDGSRVSLPYVPGIEGEIVRRAAR